METKFAIFIGGVIRGFVDRMRDKRGYNAAQKARVENAGELAASGLIAGEALMGLLVAAVVFFRKEGFPAITWMLARPLAIPIALVLVAYLIWVPLSKAGAPDEPAPPTAVM